MRCHFLDSYVCVCLCSYTPLCDFAFSGFPWYTVPLSREFNCYVRPPFGIAYCFQTKPLWSLVSLRKRAKSQKTHRRAVWTRARKNPVTSRVKGALTHECKECKSRGQTTSKAVWTRACKNPLASTGKGPCGACTSLKARQPAGLSGRVRYHLMHDHLHCLTQSRLFACAKVFLSIALPSKCRRVAVSTDRGPVKNNRVRRP